MPRIHVCSLTRLDETVRETGAGDVVTLIRPPTIVRTPETVHPTRHLTLTLSDITEPQEGELLPEARDVAALIAFIREWKRAKPMVIHCYAGVSRSTASAFITACTLRPDLPETHWAGAIRERSPTATPNILLVRLADDLLGRQGRMVSAVTAIGRGADCHEGIPFALDLASER